MDPQGRPHPGRHFLAWCWLWCLSSFHHPITEGEGAMRRVVVTGLGVVAPNGIGKEAFWSACKNGRSGVGPIKSFDASGHPVKIAAEVPDFDVQPFIPVSQRKSLKIMSRAMRFAVGAAGLGVKDSGLDLGRL